MLNVLSFCFVCGLVYLTEGECPAQTVEMIKRFWNGNPPKNILESSIGTVTYVWMTRNFIQKHLEKGLLCMVTNLAEDMETATDILVYRNRTPIADEVTYWQKEKDGVITLHSHGEPDDTQYVLSYNNYVSTFWQCKNSQIDKYEPFVGISVRISRMYSEATKTAIEEGKKLLDKLNLNTGSELMPCTERHVTVSSEEEDDVEMRESGVDI